MSFGGCRGVRIVLFFESNARGLMRVWLLMEVGYGRMFWFCTFPIGGYRYGVIFLLALGDVLCGCIYVISIRKTVRDSRLSMAFTRYTPRSLCPSIVSMKFVGTFEGHGDCWFLDDRGNWYAILFTCGLFTASSRGRLIGRHSFCGIRLIMITILSSFLYF